MINLDEFLFKYKNKAYGAYILRKNYYSNIKKAFLVTMIIVFTTFTIASSKKKEIIKPYIQDTIIIANVDIPEKVKPQEEIPEKPKINTTRYVVPLIVLDDEKTDDQLENIDSLLNQNIGIQDIEGEDSVEALTDIIDIPDDLDTIQVISPDREPDIEEFFPGKEAQSVNMDIIKKKIKYPESLKLMNISGRVIIRALVNTDGKIVKQKVMRTPHAIFVDEINKYIDELVFVPAVHNNKPHMSWVNLQFDFKLK
jgi:protein TonB